MPNNSTSQILELIYKALKSSLEAFSSFVPGAVEADQKSLGRGPVTEADRIVNRLLRDVLLQDGEGWLSEETVDDLERLAFQRVWVVDPLDGTLEFVEGIPEWCVSVGFVEDGTAVAGGVCNPATCEIFLGSVGNGVTYNGIPTRASQKKSLEQGLVLASRSEVNRGEWEGFRQCSFGVRPTGSIAYKLAMVAAGLAEATWTLNPKNEWDIAAGVALVEVAGDIVRTLENLPPTFNNKSTLLSGLVACGPNLSGTLTSLLGPHIKSRETRNY